MTIFKIYENLRGIVSSYHRVVQVVVKANETLATIHSWPARIYVEAKGDLPMSSIIETVEVPNSALSVDPLTSVQEWLISNEASHLFGGSLVDESTES